MGERNNVWGWRYILIRIVDENIFEIHLEQYRKEEVLSYVEKSAHPEELAFMLYQSGEFCGVWSVMDIIDNRACIPLYIKNQQEKYYGISFEKKEEKNVPASDNLFQIARNIFREYKGNEYQYLAVMNEADQCEFLLRYEKNRIYGEKKNGTIYDSFWNLDDEDLQCDQTLLDRYESLVIYEYNEYTDFILRYILKYTLEKKCICLDPKIKYLWRIQGEEDHFFTTKKSQKLILLQSEWQIENVVGQIGRTLFIVSDFTNEYGTPANYLSGVYSSLAVVKSMVWCGKRQSLGTLNVDKTILLLDCPVKGSGLVDLMKFTAIYCEIAKKRGFVPVVAYQDEERDFVTNPGTDFWTLFFEPVSNIAVEEAKRSANVILASENELRLVDWEMNPYVYELDCRIWGEGLWHEKENLLKRYIHPQQSILEEAKKRLPKEFCEGKKILGVIARGTDYRKESVKARGSGNYIYNEEIEDFLPKCQKLFLENDFDYLYLATEDQNYFELFLVQFGNQLLFHEQKRAIVDTKKKEALLVSDLIRTNDPTRQNIEYCYILTALGLCDELVSSMNCGAYLAGLSKIFIE